ncbi:uncharacterized protein TA21280 [Theileria annulata]|uniref:Ubiquitin-like domain-containing protein n=1 Tax=Theileria annulata TaxID=5874 RepID=Q4UGQ1_THEAN|nr:uncharacterized protein TA21280 [Theileria annulata]CAI73738.1 hypothetical protein, conserved [Theileria annulata]|eukprot:XP_954415.1 hypothetical protein, conserved [Theileria annulata]
MHQLLVFTNNCFIIFYTLYLLVMCNFNKNVLCVATNINRNYNYPKIYLNRYSPKFCMANNEISHLKPVQLSINTFWGRESQFNSKIPITVNLNDTFLNVKKLIFNKTGIPVELQDLYLLKSSDFSPKTEDNSDDLDNDISLENCVKLKDDDRVSNYLRHFKLTSSKELELDLLLDLPAPTFKSVSPDPNRIGDYITAVIRYNDLLMSINNMKSNLKDKNCLNNINSFIKDSNCYINSELNGDKPKESQPPIKDLGCKRVYIRIFKDYPSNSHLFRDRLNNIIRMYFPVDLSNTFKFSAFCLLLKLNGNFNKTTLDIIGLLPLLAIFVQTRAGILFYRTLFHFISQQYIPKSILDSFQLLITIYIHIYINFVLVLYNILPAHLAEKIRNS